MKLLVTFSISDEIKGLINVIEKNNHVCLNHIKKNSF